jgi:hypothetical protein
LALLVTGCTSIELASSPPRKSEDTERIDYTVTVVVDDNGCPLFTLFDDQPGGVPDLRRPDTIGWKVTTVSGNPLPVGFKFRVIFDPLQGGRRLIGEDVIDNIHLESEEELPEKASYKYTIVKVLNNSGQLDLDCKALDPMIRII